MFTIQFISKHLSISEKTGPPQAIGKEIRLKTNFVILIEKSGSPGSASTLMSAQFPIEGQITIFINESILR
jgi:hypothetical protein